jgi:SagB-type dehydrogenase family enzyme
MPNHDIDASWKYHNGTKHSPLSVRANPHFLDWGNKPLAFKIYPTLEVMRLSKDIKKTAVPALCATTSAPASCLTQATLDLEAIAQILFLSAGVTKSKKYPGNEIFFRAAACTGALYEIELYVVSGDLPGLSAGVYHFSVAEFGLRQLRAGDFRQQLVEATANEPAIAKAPVTVICTGTYWRNAWKYRSRTYRHFGWDNGTILANLLAASSALGFPAKVVLGFVDHQVNALLDLNTQREVAFSLVPLGQSSPAPAVKRTIDRLGLTAVAYSKTEVEYPAMRLMHDASSLLSQEEVAAWRKNAQSKKPSLPSKEGLDLRPLSDKAIPGDPIEQVILRRGSARKFPRNPLTFAQLSTLLDRTARGVPADFLEPGTQWNDLYLVVNNVEEIAPGAYFYDRNRKKLVLLKEGEFRNEVKYLALEQQLAGDASVNFFFLADLETILARLGNRGYRAAQLEAGIVGGKLYLAAYALHLGASGLTFYDDEVVNFFSPHAKGKSAIFLVAVGKASLEHPFRKPSRTSRAIW